MNYEPLPMRKTGALQQGSITAAMPKEQDSGMGMLPIRQASQARELKPLQPDETSYQPCCALWKAAQLLSAFSYFATVTFAKVCRARTGKNVRASWRILAENSV